MAVRRTSRSRSTAAEARVLDPEGHYGAGDLVVATDRELPWSDAEGLDLDLPVRELLYRIVRRRGPLPLPDLARELAAVAPGVVRPPYLEDPALYVLRLVAGSRAALPALADLPAMIRALARIGPDPDYGLVVRPA
jgi:hypothetical protein